MARLRLGLLATGLCIWAVAAPAQNLAAHVHIGHVMTAWPDTPGGQGLLPVAEGKAETALQAAAMAAKRPGDRQWTRRHVARVLAAVDPDTGYGVLRAAMMVNSHITLAANAADATRAVKLHAGRVGASAANVARWGERVARLSRRVMEDANPADAAQAVGLILDLCRRIVSGVDADGDGRVSSTDKEGGLKQARRAMIFMMRAEGLR